MSRIWSGQAASTAREEAGFARPDDAAEAIGVHRASVYAWEGGREPQLRHAIALAELYGITVDSLFVHEPEADTPANGRGERIAHTHRARSGDSPVTAGTGAAKGA